jgi:uncharacterized protein YjbI with pentapeptide repeats
LQDANLSGANLSGVGWDAVTLAGVDMSIANLTGAHINGSAMTDAVRPPHSRKYGGSQLGRQSSNSLWFVQSQEMCECRVIMN